MPVSKKGAAYQSTEELETMKENDATKPENIEELAGKPDTPETVEGTDGSEEAPASDLLKIQNELSEQKDKYLRLYSEFENFRRRTAKEKVEMIQSANEQLIKALLPVVDDFERAAKTFNDKAAKELEGFFLIYNKFKKTLDQYGVKVMELKAGSDFNPDLHEAITQVPVTDEKLKGKIVDVVEQGYLLNEKVIRFAKIVVGS